MDIAIASGKGGTGKTTIAVNLAYVASLGGQAVSYLDCDVEEPNGHIFLSPEIILKRQVSSLIPEIDQDRCTRCGLCDDICQYKAIVRLPDIVLVFPELCHSCGGCSLVCPANAITEKARPIGEIETGVAGSVGFVRGLLNIGEAQSTPVIRAVKAYGKESGLRILDAPPGTSCPVIESVRGSDFVILATEPTPFGLNDLQLAVDVIRKLGIPFGVVINRAGNGFRGVNNYCDEQAIEILAEISDDRSVAESYSRGELISQHVKGYEAIFVRLLEKVISRAGDTAIKSIAGDLNTDGIEGQINPYRTSI